MRAGQHAPNGSRAGFVLVSVLWALVLIAGLSALFVGVLGLQLRSNAAIVRGAAAEALADGAIRAIAWRLASMPPGTVAEGDAAAATGGPASAAPMPFDGTWFGCQMFDGTQARISVQDQDGLIDLNAAPLPLLAQLVEARLDPADARRALGAIEPFRALAAKSDVDPEGAAANRLDLGAPGVFATPDELIGMIGDEAKADALLPFLTVYSKSDGVDPMTAPATLMTALGGNPRDRAASLPPEISRTSRMRFFAITADVGAPQLGRSARRAVVELLRQPDKPFAVWEWSTVDAGGAGVPSALRPTQACIGESGS